MSQIYTEIQKWFNLDNYRDIEHCTLRALHKELEYRKELHTTLNFWDDDDLSHEKIFNGKPLISHIANMTEHLTYSETHIQQVSFGHIRELESSLMHFSEDVFIRHSKDFKPGLRLQPVTKVMEHHTLAGNDCRIYISFDLKFSTDEEILNSMQTLLPLWRKEYGVSKKEMGSFGLSRIIKIVDYRIIPMVDLLLWANWKNVSLSNTLLSRVLYPDMTDDVRGEDQIKETDRPIAEKVLSGDIIRKTENLINKNRHLIDTPVSQLRALI